VTALVSFARQLQTFPLKQSLSNHRNELIKEVAIKAIQTSAAALTFTALIFLCSAPPLSFSAIVLFNGQQILFSIVKTAIENSVFYCCKDFFDSFSTVDAPNESATSDANLIRKLLSFLFALSAPALSSANISQAFFQIDVVSKIQTLLTPIFFQKANTHPLSQISSTQLTMMGSYFGKDQSLALLHITSILLLCALQRFVSRMITYLLPEKMDATYKARIPFTALSLSLPKLARDTALQIESDLFITYCLKLTRFLPSHNHEVTHGYNCSPWYLRWVPAMFLLFLAPDLNTNEPRNLPAPTPAAIR
jgi:hypothetical protein